MDYFKTQLLYNHSLNSNSKDYKSKKLTHNCLPSFFVVLLCFKLAVHRHSMIPR